jgi:uncharacterized protein YegP (UPF0339 family)
MATRFTGTVRAMRFYVYGTDENGWCWTLVLATGRIVAHGERFTRRRNAVAAAIRLHRQFHTLTTAPKVVYALPPKGSTVRYL